MLLTIIEENARGALMSFATAQVVLYGESRPAVLCSDKLKMTKKNVWPLPSLFENSWPSASAIIVVSL